jgi:hypothetical protein
MNNRWMAGKLNEGNRENTLHWCKEKWRHVKKIKQRTNEWMMTECACVVRVILYRHVVFHIVDLYNNKSLREVSVLLLNGGDICINWTTVCVCVWAGVGGLTWLNIHWSVEKEYCPEISFRVRIIVAGYSTHLCLIYNWGVSWKSKLSSKSLIN